MLQRLGYKGGGGGGMTLPDQTIRQSHVHTTPGVDNSPERRLQLLSYFLAKSGAQPVGALQSKGVDPTPYWTQRLYEPGLQPGPAPRQAPTNKSHDDHQASARYPDRRRCYCWRWLGQDESGRRPQGDAYPARHAGVRAQGGGWDARFDELDKVVEELTRKEKVDGRKKRE